MKSRFVFVRPLIMAMTLLSVVLFACEKSEENTTPALRSQEYAVSAVNGSGADGKIIISENADSSFNVQVNINNSVKDTVHVMHIHNGSVGTPGSIAIPLNGITGTGAAAQSTTMNIKQVILPDSSVQNITYSQILNFNGYVNVHYSAAQIDSLVAQGNIGSN